MSKIVSIALSFLIIGFVSCGQSAQIQKIKWEKLCTEKEVMDELKKYVPIGSTETHVTSFLESQKLERFGKIENYYFAYAKTKSKSFWIAKEWMMKFYLGEDSKLDSIFVEAALTGP